MQVPATITCVECGGPAHLVSYAPPDEPFTPEDVVAYVCVECDHRHDLVVGDGSNTDSQQDV